MVGRGVLPKAPLLGQWSVFKGDALDAYDAWPAPAAIISDGAYGVRGFPGDPPSADGLADWYAPHVKAWSERARPSTTLWFWNTELGWATVHPLLAGHGWEYVQTVVWDKGIAHIAGNVNSGTIRRFPVATEVCAFYRRRLVFPTPGGEMPAKRWLRHEWQRTGLALSEANRACGVADAATRKYLTQDWRWYLPPPEMMGRLVDYANTHGRPDGAPYYSFDGTAPVTADEWAGLSDHWTHSHGITNVWSAPPLHGAERYKVTTGEDGGNEPEPGGTRRSRRPGRNASTHPNQKPLEFMRRIVSACTRPGDVVWEPFGGLCSAAAAAVELGRDGYAAETEERYAALAAERIGAHARHPGVVRPEQG